MSRKLVITLLLVLSGLSLNAGTWKDHPGFILKKHEISVSVAAIPSRALAGYDFNFLAKAGIGYGNTLANTYFNAATYNIEKSTLLWSLNYLYNINRILAIGASVSYEVGSDAYYYRSDNSLFSKESKNVFTTMAHIRSSWLNRPLVRMYSQLSVGAAYSMEGDFDYPYEHITFQIAPVGISVGKDIYGYAELGFGIAYVGCNFGLGYRF